MPPSIRPHRHLPLAYISGFWSLVILLLVTNVPAYAEWVMFSGNEEAGLIVYVDPDTIRRKGDLVKMWHLKDFKTNQSSAFGEYLSYKVLDQYDCAEERKRMLSATHFSHNMGNGLTVLSIVDEGKWYPVEPGSVGEAQWMFACGNRSSRREGRPLDDTKSPPQEASRPPGIPLLAGYNFLFFILL